MSRRRRERELALRAMRDALRDILASEGCVDISFAPFEPLPGTAPRAQA